MAAKKRKPAKKNSRSKKQQKPEHRLPAGFWAQTGAVVLLLIAILQVVTWFDAGGPVLDWIHARALTLIGWAAFALPPIFIFCAVEIFKQEENKVPLVTKIGSFLTVIWLSGLFGLMEDRQGNPTGGWLGELLNNSVMLPLVSSSVAVLIYAVLIFLSILAIVRAAPNDIIKRIVEWSQSNLKEEERSNKKTADKLAKEESPKKTPLLKFGGGPDKPEKTTEVDGGFKIDKGVPIEGDDKVEKKKKPGRSSFQGTVESDPVAESAPALVSVSNPDWVAPSLEILEKKQSPANTGDINDNAQTIKQTLSEFNIEAEMESANIGPKVTQYKLRPPSGVRLSRISALEPNIALNLGATSIRIEAPIPGQKAVGIEVPNLRAADVRLYGVLTSPKWKSSKEPLTFAIGKDISGEPVVGELNKMPHLLIAGQTGSGKSVMINTLLSSLLYRNSPSEMKLILVDPKQVEMAAYEDIPHLLTPVINEPEKTISALKWAVNEMERRYKLLASEKIKDIKTYNKHLQQRGRRISVEDDSGHMQEHEEGAMPYIVIVIDELADLMMVAARDVEGLIVRLAQKARAVGIHLVLATQRPSVNVITGLIKANVPARIAFTVASQVDSRTILDMAGAEKLLGQGDMLMKTAQMAKPRRIQGAWVTDEEVAKITKHLCDQSAPQYNDEIVSQPVQINGKGGVVMDFDSDGEGLDDVYKDAVKIVVDSKKASASLLQRRLRIGYSRASRVMDQLEEQGVIGPADGARPREVLINSVDELE